MFQERVLAVLFRGVFEEERDPSDPDFLAEVGMAAGLFSDVRAGRRALLDDVELTARVDAEERQARNGGICASPSYSIQGRYRVGGMQEASVFLKLFDKIAGAEGGEATEIKKESA
jgi:predicted DsbA family dithiol-disulfide isomerase